MKQHLRLARRAFIGAALVAGSTAAFAGLFGNTVDGSGRIASDTRTLSGYKSIAIHGPFKVVLRQSGREGVQLQGDDNLLPLVETTVSGQALEIGPKKGTDFGRQQVVVTVDFISLHALSLDGSGQVGADGLIAPRLDVAIGGSSQLQLDRVDAGTVNVALGGSGGLRAGGKARRLVLVIGGSGSVQAGQLQAEDVTVSVGGSGGAAVHAANTLKVSVAGSGSVVYSGDPKVSKSVAGSGTVSRH